MEILEGRKIPEKQDITPHSLCSNEKFYTAEHCDEVTMGHLLKDVKKITGGTFPRD